jgi:hypothetical protein
MKKSELKALIKECYGEIINESQIRGEGINMASKGKGRYKVNYVKGPNVGYNRFGNINVARKFARGMIKQGWDVDVRDGKTGMSIEITKEE